MTGGGLDVPIPFVGLLGQPADRCGCERRRGREVRPGRRHGSRPGHRHHPGRGRRPGDHHADRRQAPPSPRAFVGRQIVVGSTTATIVDQGDAHPHPGPAARHRTGRRHRLPRGERAPGCRPRAHRLDAGHAAGRPRDRAGLARQQLDHRLRAGRQRRRQAAPRPDLGAQVRRLPAGEPRPRRPGARRTRAPAASSASTASGTVKLRLLLPLTAGGHARPDRRTPSSTRPSPRSTSGVKVDADAAHIGASIGPVSVDLGKAPAEPGSFNAGIGVEIAGKAAGDDTPSITDFFTRASTSRVTNGGALRPVPS